MKLFYYIFLLQSVWLHGCIHPAVGIRKSRLVDPMMDPAAAGDFGETAMSSVSGFYERAIINGGGTGGGSCPTCK